jgi:4-hydroxybenzoate polyprenyltransferase/phosphoserine phosphatase
MNNVFSMDEVSYADPVGSPIGPMPLVVDLDGTLVRSDLLVENFFAEMAARPGRLMHVPGWLKNGKATLKHELAKDWKFDASTLPYDAAVLAAIESAAAEGRPVYLASASNSRIVSEVAEHLGVFSGWFASDETTNLAGSAKAQLLVDAFGERGFDYIGNDRADVDIWRVARRAFAIRAGTRLTRRLGRIGCPVDHMTAEAPGWRGWAKLLRVHQYAKNGLVFVPLFTSAVFTAQAFGNAALAAIAFSLVASAVYIINDLTDLQDDRQHWSKRNRPLACGRVELKHAIAVVPLLILAGFGVAAFISLPFVGVLAGYLALTSAYSFYLKKVMILDVVTLACLYSLRVVAGAVAIGVTVSEWLIGFCVLIFTALALVKRYVELAARQDAQLPDSSRRGYRASDLSMVGWMASAAGFNAVTVLALYLSTRMADAAYPALLWVLCPVLMYWFARVLMLAHRRQLHDDPIAFALSDRASIGMLGLSVAVVVAAG